MRFNHQDSDCVPRLPRNDPLWHTRSVPGCANRKQKADASESGKINTRDYINHYYLQLQLQTKQKKSPYLFLRKTSIQHFQQNLTSWKNLFETTWITWGPTFNPWPPDDLVCHAHPHDSRSSLPPGGRPDRKKHGSINSMGNFFFYSFWGVHNIKLRQVFKHQTCLKNIKIFKCVELIKIKL